jgi:hypothetical protein
MAAYNISINQGESYNLDATLISSSGTKINLSGYDLRGQVRYSYGSTGVLLNLAPTVTNHTGGAININLTAEQTASLPTTIAVYDIESFPTGDGAPNIVNRVLNGLFSISPEVTR